MPKVPNERDPDDKPDLKVERQLGEGGLGKADTGGLVQPPSVPGEKPHAQDGPMDRPGTEADEQLTGGPTAPAGAIDKQHSGPKAGGYEDHAQDLMSDNRKGGFGAGWDGI